MSPGGRWTRCPRRAVTRSARSSRQPVGCSLPSDAERLAQPASVAGTEVERGLTELVALGLAVGQVEPRGRRDALEVAPGPFQPRVALQQPPEVGAVTGRE